MGTPSTGQPILASVPPEEARLYAAHRADLVAFVNRVMRARKDLPDLTGGAPWELVAANHDHHGRFLADVMRFGRYPLLSAVVAWAYRAYRARGFSYDYFPAHLSAWRMALAEILPALQAVPALYEELIRRHDTTVREAEKGVGSFAAEPAEEHRAAAHRLAGLLVAGERDAVDQAVRAHLSAGMTVAELGDRILCPAMGKVGADWEGGRISVAHEHLATSILSLVLARLAATRARPASRDRRALVTAAPNETHEMGGWIVADALTSDGYTVRYLGADTPAPALAAYAAEFKPDLVALSIGTAFNLTPAAAAIEGVRAALPSCRILAGGIPFGFDPGIGAAIGADATPTGAVHALEVAARLAS